MDLIKKTLENKYLQKHLNSSNSFHLGEILGKGRAINGINNTLNIKLIKGNPNINNPSNINSEILNNVPYLIDENIIGDNWEEGDKVLVGYTDSDSNSPYIMSLKPTRDIITSNIGYFNTEDMDIDTYEFDISGDSGTSSNTSGAPYKVVYINGPIGKNNGLPNFSANTNISTVDQYITYEFGEKEFNNYIYNTCYWRNKNIAWFDNIVSSLKWNKFSFNNNDNYVLACAGQALLIALTSKFAKNGDYIVVHFTNGSYLPCIKFDEKSSEDPNWTQWGHWAPVTDKTKLQYISILEFTGRRSGYFNIVGLKVDYIINLGVNIADNPSLCKSTSKMIELAKKIK